jgi:PAS domain S-box-containing protein
MQKLINSELRYRRLFETTQDGILILDAKTGLIEDVNPYLIKMLGYSRAEFVEKKLWEVGAFKDINASKDAFDALQEHEYIRYDNLPLKAKDGQLIEVEFVSNVYLAGDTKVIQCNIRDTTEHKRIITVLQANEQKYHDLIDQSPDGYFIIELSGHILTVNPAMCKELEFSEAEFLSMYIWDIIPEQFLDQYRERLTKILKGETFREAAEYVVHGKDGRHHFVEVLSAPRYSGVDIIGFQGIARDVTARKRTEEALQTSEASNRRLVENLPVVVYTNAVGDTSSTLYVSPQIKDLVGYTPEEWLADPKLWSKTLHPEDRQRVLTKIASTDQTQKPYEMEYRLIAKDGHVVWVHDQLVRMNDVEGQGQLWQGIMLDITERKLAEEKLHISEERLRVGLNTVDIAVFNQDLDLRYVWMYQPQLGYTAEQVTGHTDAELMPPESSRNLMEIKRSVLESGLKVRTEYAVSADGQTNIYDLVLEPQRDTGGAIIGLMGASFDITERKQAEESLRDSREFLQSVQDSLTAHIAILDDKGTIVQVNSAWRDFGAENELNHSDHGIGMNYLDVCDSAKGEFAEPASLVANAIREACRGEKAEILVEYPCHSPDEERWFMARITSFENTAQRWIVVMHINTTQRRQTEGMLRNALQKTTRGNSMLKALSFAAQAAQRAHTPQDIYQAIGDSIKELGFNLVIYDVDMEKREISLAFMNFAPKLVIAAEKLVGLSAKTHRFPLIADGFYDRILLADNSQIFFDVAAALTEALPRFLRSFTNQLIRLVGIKQGIYAALKVGGKPQSIMIVSGGDLGEADVSAMDILVAQISVALENASLIESLQRSNTDLTMAYDATIVGWSHALDLRDKETEGHSQRVTTLTVKLASIFDFSEAEQMQIRWGALLHDIGKMGVPDGILLKPGSLTEEEWAVMKKHPIFAYEMLSPISHMQLALDIPY